MKLVTILLTAFLLTSCAFSPSRKVERTQQAVAETQRELDRSAERRAREAAAYAFGVGKALDAAPQSPGVAAAETLNDRVKLLLDPPTVADATDVGKIAAGLVAGDPAASERLAIRDSVSIRSQKAEEKLGAKLDQQEQKRDEVSLSVSALADRFVRLRGWFRFALFCVAALVFGPVLLRLLAVLVPASGPIAGIAASIFSRVGRSILKAVPQAAERAGYVAAERFQQVQHALDDTVTAVQKLRSDPDVREKIDPVLLNETDKRVSRPVIREVKDRLNLKGAS